MRTHARHGSLSVAGVILTAGMVVAVALEGCSSGHGPAYNDGYSYGHSAAKQDYTGSLTGAGADDACNHALQAVPDGFGDPSNADWVAGFMAGCTAELASPRSAAGAVASSTPSSSTPHVTATCVVGYEQPEPNPDVLASEVSSADYTHSTFKTGTPVGVTVGGDYWAPTKAYKLTVTNNFDPARYVVGDLDVRVLIPERIDGPS